MSKTKKPSKINNLNQSISLNSSRGRLILFLLAFVIVGGGIMAYRSFAASGTININAGWNNISATVQPAQIVKETSGSKSNATLWQLGPNGIVTANTVLPPLAESAPFNICAGIKATSAGTVKFVFGNSQHGGAAPVNVTAAADYKEYCAPMTFLSAYGNSYNPGVFNTTRGTIRVSFIQLNYNSQDACYVSGDYISGSYTPGTSVSCNAYGSYSSYSTYY